jgi:crotonobetainyl-CoA:carnitine CoA-transferase CaiB-like acyl-CoA transferase
MAGILEGLTVIEAGGEMAASIAGMLFADYGARVIKLEPESGDPFRTLPGARVWHRGKKSVAVDLETDAGRTLLERLLSKTDVLLTGFSPQGLVELRLDGRALRAAFPRLVFAHITGYGLEGRDRDRPYYDALVSAHLGLHYQQAGARPGPHYLGFPAASYSAAMLTVLGTMTALYLREESERGQIVDVSLKDGALAMMTMQWASAERGMSTATGSAFHKKRLLVQNFRCRDGEWLHLHTGAVGAFERLMTAMGLDEYAGRPFAGESEWQEMVTKLEAIFARCNRDESMKTLYAADVPALPILRHGEALHDEQSRVMGFGQRVPDPELGELLEVSPPVIFAGYETTASGSWPSVGANTCEFSDQAGGS